MPGYPRRAPLSWRPTTPPHAAWKPLLGLQLLLAAALGGAWALLHPGGSGPDPETLASLDLPQAAQVLAARRELVEADLGGALGPEDEALVSNFCGLQVQAADLELIELRWLELPREGVLVPVELTLRVAGDSYALPVLVDGLYNQSHPVVVTWLELETPDLGGSEVLVTLRLRFWRLPPSDTRWVEGEAARLFPEDAYAQSAMVDAARGWILEASREALKERERRSHANRRAVTMELPALVLAVPRSALGWLALQAEGDGVVRLTEPE